MKNIFWLISLFVLASCEKEIEIKLNEADTRLVVEGNITNQTQKHTVKLSKTVSFTSTNALPTVSGALVTIENGAGFSETLTETVAGTYQTTEWAGEAGKAYTLRVVAEGKTYTASCKMPNAVPLKDLRIEKRTFGPPAAGSTNEDIFYVVPLYDDPVELGNSYRFLQSIGDKKDNTYIIFNDNVSNGLPNERPVVNPDFELKRGNVFTLEMRCIDKPVYDYFFALASIAGQGAGGGTTPTNPPSNVSGGALGYFSVHTVQKMTITIP